MTSSTAKPAPVGKSMRARLSKLATQMKQVRRANKRHSSVLLVNQSVAKALFKRMRAETGHDTMRISRNGRTAVRHLVTTIMSRLMHAVNLNSAQFKTSRIPASRINVAAQLVGLPGNESRVRRVSVEEVIRQCHARTSRNKERTAAMAVSADDYVMTI